MGSPIFFWVGINPFILFNPYIRGRLPWEDSHVETTKKIRFLLNVAHFVYATFHVPRRPTRAWPNSCGPCFHPWMFSQGVDTAAWYLNKNMSRHGKFSQKTWARTIFVWTIFWWCFFCFLFWQFLIVSYMYSHQSLQQMLQANSIPHFFSRYVECLAHVFSSSR